MQAMARAIMRSRSRRRVTIWSWSRPRPAIGENRIDLYLTDGQGQPVDAKAAELSFALPEMGIEALRVDAAAVEPGHFQGRVDLPLAGDWQVHADLLVDDFTKLPFQARIVVARSGEAH